MLHEDLVYMSTNIAYNMPNPGETFCIPEANKACDISKQYMVLDVKTSEPQAMLVCSMNPPYETAVIFEGSVQADDWYNDSQLASGAEPAQFNKAVRVFDEFQKKISSGQFSGYGIPINNISYVAGNSLGGGLANYVATQRNNLSSVTINPSVIPEGTGIISNSQYTNYISDNDPLNNSQEGTGLKEGRVPGNQISIHSGGPSASDIVRSHQGRNKEGEGEAHLKLPKNLLTGNAIGNGETIEINPESLDKLNNGITERISVVANVSKDLEGSRGSLTDFNNNLESRKEQVLGQERQVILDAFLAGLTISVDKFVEKGLWNILKEFTETHIDFYATIMLVNDEIDAVDLCLKNFLIELDQELHEEVPKLFSGYSYVDGTPDKLIEYIDIINGNVSIYNNNLETFKTHITNVKKSFVNSDNSYFTQTEGSYSSEYIDINMDDKTIENAKKILELQFEEKIGDFSIKMDEFVKKWAGVIVEKLQKLYDTVDGHIGIEILVNGEPERKLNEAMTYVKALIEILKKSQNTNIVKDAILGNKKVIKAAILAPGTYYTVNSSNYNALAKMQLIYDEFSFLAINIDGNQGATAKRLKEIFNILTNQTKFIVGQIEDIVVGVEIDYD